jgi:hypothetical protein
VSTETTPTSESGAAQRDGHGRFRPGHSVTLKHGRYSERAQTALLPEQDTLRRELAQLRDELIADLGGPERVGVVMGQAAESYLRLWTLAETLWAGIEKHGPLTPKGRQRAATSLLLQILDRMTRLAQQLGMERRLKPANTIDDYIRQRQVTA